MALATFSPSIAPSPGTSHKPQVKLHKAEFGDGYTQASPAGLNHIRHNVALKWDALTETQVAELETFFTDHGGYRSFYYQPRGFATPLKWTCSDWRSADASPWRFEAQLEESFTVET